MKRIIVVALLILSVAFAFADGDGKRGPWMMGGMHPGRMEEGSPGFLGLPGPEILRLLEAQGNRELGSVTLSDLRKLILRIEELKMASLYIERSKKASFYMPGVGQFMNEEPLSGSLFLTAHLGVIAGSLVGSYFLLPADLRFDRTDYLNESISVIKDRWRSHSLQDYLPAIGVMAGGHLVDLLLRLWSADNAEKLAERRVKSGAFKVRPFFEREKHGFGFGMGMMW